MPPPLTVSLPPIPAKRYFTIGEVSELCSVKPHVLRYWEQEFTQLSPIKRRGNRRYYQHHEVLMIRRIRDLLYEQGFTISVARNKLQELKREQFERDKLAADLFASTEHLAHDPKIDERQLTGLHPQQQLVRELKEIRELLS